MRGPVRELLEIRSAFLADVDTTDEVDERDEVGGEDDRLLVRSDLTGTMQLYEHAAGALRQLTALADPVGAARYVPRRRQAVVQVDATGNEHHQLYLLDLAVEAPVSAREKLVALTSAPEFGHHLAGVSPSGGEVAYLSNRRNGVDFDLWICDLGSHEHRALYTGGGWCRPSSGFSPDGRYVAIGRPGPRPLDVDLLLVDVSTGDIEVVLPHPDEAAEVGSPAWTSTSAFFVSSNVGTDRAAVVHYDVETRRTTPFPGTAGDWDARAVTSRDGRVLLVVENRHGASRMRLFDARSWESMGEVPVVEAGVVDPYMASPPTFNGPATTVYYSLTTPRRAGDVWAAARGPSEPRQLTASPAPFSPSELASAELAETCSFDGETIPLYLFRPAGMGHVGPPPVVVVVHGGPESQAVQAFNPVVQALAASGYGVVVPNVRGSTGYGKRYASLDDRTLRLDSVRDLAAVHAWLGTEGFDSERAALWGGSYGGYMVLAGLAFQPELWAAGVDIVGISDLVTFLEHTSDYRRAHREREYGSLVHDRAFLEEASPMRRADAIRAPLFVIHGRNDPRVPLSEAEQLVARLQSRGVRVELAVYDDEGHGLARLPNRIDAYSRAIDFLGDVLAVAGTA